MIACAQAKAQSDDLVHSRIQIVPRTAASSWRCAASAAIRNAWPTARRRRSPRTTRAASSTGTARNASTACCARSAAPTAASCYDARGRPRRQVRHVRRRPGLRQGLRARRAEVRHDRAHLQRGRRSRRPVRAGTLRLPGLQHRTDHAPHAAPHRPGDGAGDAARLHPGHGLGRLQRPDRHQGAGVPSAADQHRVDAGRRQAPTTSASAAT